MADGVWLVYTEIALDEHQVADDVVSDPLELIPLETVFCVVPLAPVLATDLTDLLDVGQDELLCKLVRVFSFPERLYRLGLGQVHAEVGCAL